VHQPIAGAGVAFYQPVAAIMALWVLLPAVFAVQLEPEVHAAGLMLWQSDKALGRCCILQQQIVLSFTQVGALACVSCAVLRRQDLPAEGGSSRNQGIPSHRTHRQGVAEVLLGEQLKCQRADTWLSGPVKFGDVVLSPGCLMRCSAAVGWVERVRGHIAL
jgi:hypothetical protein